MSILRIIERALVIALILLALGMTWMMLTLFAVQFEATVADFTQMNVILSIVAAIMVTCSLGAVAFLYHVEFEQ